MIFVLGCIYNYLWLCVAHSWTLLEQMVDNLLSPSVY